MIDKLTEEQQERLKQWRTEWWETGICTDPADREQAEEIMLEMYKISGAGTPRFVWVNGPTEAKKVIGKRSPTPYSWGGAEAHWLALYTFGKYLGVPFDKDDTVKLELWIRLVKCCGYVYLLDDGDVIMCERPAEIHMDAPLGRLHNDNGPAILCRDGTKVYAMNGVKVPQWLAETPAEELDASRIAKIDNAEVRAQFVRKIGVERLYEALKGKILDTYFHNLPDGRELPYELVEMDIPGMRQKAVFLKMLNATDEKIHMEGVPPEIRTCKEALRWRHPEQEIFNPVYMS